jgi:hypothetical protein
MLKTKPHTTTFTRPRRSAKLHPDRRVFGGPRPAPGCFPVSARTSRRLRLALDLRARQVFGTLKGIKDAHHGENIFIIWQSANSAFSRSR